MIDLHSHILHNLDDGSKSLDESLKLCKEAVLLGYRYICCTSHYIKGKYENENYENRFQELKEAIRKEKLPLDIYMGNEINLDIDTFILLSKNKFNTLGYSKYLLVEFPKGILLDVKINLLKMLKTKEYKIILTHVERYPELSLDDIRKLKQYAMIQCNINAINFISNRFEVLLLDGTIDLVASDAHNLEHRNYNLKKQLEKLKELVGERIFERLTYSNAIEILMDE